MIDIPFMKKKENPEEAAAEEQQRGLEAEVIKGSSPQFTSIAEDNIQLTTNIIEPASHALYDQNIILTDLGKNEEGQQVYGQRTTTVQKIMRDLALGNFDAITLEQVENYLHLAEECEDMGFNDASDYLTKIAYQKVNASRGKDGFLQKQLGTRAIEFTRKAEKKEGGLLRK